MPFTVTAVHVESALTVKVSFSASVGTGATTPSNYLIGLLGQGTLTNNPDSAAVISGHPDQVLLTWNTGEMTNGENVRITVTNVLDSNGNALGTPHEGIHFGGGIGYPPRVTVAQWEPAAPRNTISLFFNEEMIDNWPLDSISLSGPGKGTMPTNPTSIDYEMTWNPEHTEFVSRVVCHWTGTPVSGQSVTLTVYSVAYDLAYNPIDPSYDSASVTTP